MKSIVRKPAIEIVIKGDKGSGRTTLLHIVGACLKAEGLNVACLDDVGAFDPIPITARKIALDDRRILVSVSDV